jgi:hypothetical protein
VVGKLLKKRNQTVREWFTACQSRRSKTAAVLPYGFKAPHGQGKEGGNFPPFLDASHNEALVVFPEQQSGATIPPLIPAAITLVL